MPGSGSISDAAPAERRSVRTGLIGRAIGESRSPWLHETEARAQGFDLTYERIDFDARNLADDALATVVRGLPAKGFAGFNVTFPFKQAIMPLLDALAPSAAHIGAVNTVAIRDGRMTGHNTDGPGFADSLSRELPGAALGRVLQVGAGGAGSAVAVALIGAGVGELFIADVDPARAVALCARIVDLFGPGRASPRSIAWLPIEVVDGIVNATPIGMAGRPGVPFDPAPLVVRQWVADIIYFPAETALVHAARARGCRAINGSGMVIAQAALAFEIMTGAPANIDRMRASFAPVPTSV